MLRYPALSPVVMMVLGGCASGSNVATLAPAPTWFRQTVECVGGVVEWSPPDDAIMISVKTPLQPDDNGDATLRNWSYGGTVPVETGVISLDCMDDVEFVYATMPVPG